MALLDLENLQGASHRVSDRAHQFFHNFGGFVFKQNILALAIGVIIGTATNNVVQALIRDAFMPTVNVVIKDQAWITWGPVIGTINVANLDASGNPIYEDAQGVIPLDARGMRTRGGGWIQKHQVPNKLLLGDLLWQFTNLVVIGMIAYMMSRYLLRPPPPDPPGPPTKTCPFCLENIVVPATVCKFCTREQPLAPAVAPAGPAAPPATT